MRWDDWSGMLGVCRTEAKAWRKWTTSAAVIEKQDVNRSVHFFNQGHVLWCVSRAVMCLRATAGSEPTIQGHLRDLNARIAERIGGLGRRDV